MGIQKTLNIMVARISTGGHSTALRGRIPARFIVYPFLICTTIACGLSIWVETKRTGSAAWVPVGVYACLWFFAQMYGLAWRVGAIVFRMASLLVTVLLLALMSWYHVDQARARVDFGPPPGMAHTSRIPAPGELVVSRYHEEPVLLAAAWFDGVAGVLLLAHGLYLGWGGRPKLKGALELEHLAQEMEDLDAAFERELRAARGRATPGQVRTD